MPQILCSPVFHHTDRVISGFKDHLPWRMLFQAVFWQAQKDLAASDIGLKVATAIEKVRN